MKVLLVDDEKEILEVLKDLIFISFDNTEIDTALDGVDASILCSEKAYDIVITDFRMSKMDGEEFIQHMRKMDSSKNKLTPVIVLSGFISDAEERLSQFEALTFMTKPYNSENLLETIGQITGNKIF